MSEGLRLVVRVKPGSSKPRVGGRYGDDELVVAVAARPVDGAANQAVVGALAKAFDTAPREIELLLGATSRTKVLLITGDADALARRRQALLDEV